MTFGFILNRDASKQLDPALGHMHLHETFSLFKFKFILNGKCGVVNSGPILALQRLFEPDLNNGPSPSHSNLVSDGIYIYSGLLLMVSWWVPYLLKGCRPDVNNGLVGDSNSGPVLAPGVYLSPTRIIWSSPTPILCQMKYTSVLFKSPIYDFLVVTISGQGPHA